MEGGIEQDFIKENIDKVKRNIAEACRRVGRQNDVTLIAVSKTKPVSMIYEAMDTGIRVFGENKVQELCDKLEVIKEPLEWHLIGHLQRNKVKYIIDKAALIHSVDSLRLAEQINEEALKKDIIAHILIEINIAAEDTKYGISVNEAPDLIRQAAGLKNLRIEGLMCIAPYTDVPESNRSYFRKMKQLSVDIKDENIDNVNMNVLSMGMTGDYEIAIEEGATHIRVGTGIFGYRDYVTMADGGNNG